MGEAGRGLHGLSGARVGIMEAQVPGSEIEGAFPCLPSVCRREGKGGCTLVPTGASKGHPDPDFKNMAYGDQSPRSD